MIHHKKTKKAYTRTFLIILGIIIAFLMTMGKDIFLAQNQSPGDQLPKNFGTFSQSENDSLTKSSEFTIHLIEFFKKTISQIKEI